MHDECKWYEHSFLRSNDGSVVSLTLGWIPSELSELPWLPSLWLTSAKLNGTVPSELGLPELKKKSNELSGTIPIELGNL